MGVYVRSANTVLSAAAPELWWQLGPALPSLEVLPRLVAILSNELAIATMPDSEQTIRRFDWTVRPVAKELLDFPEISVGQPPVVRIEHSQVEHAITFDPARVIHITFGVTRCESAWCWEQRLSSMESRIPGASNGAPACLCSIHENHVIEKIDRFEAKNERRIAVLLEKRCREQRSFEAVSSSCSHYTAKPTHRVACRLTIVWQIIQPALYRERRAEIVDEASLHCLEVQMRCINLRCIGKSHS